MQKIVHGYDYGYIILHNFIRSGLQMDRIMLNCPWLCEISTRHCILTSHLFDLAVFVKPAPPIDLDPLLIEGSWSQNGPWKISPTTDPRMIQYSKYAIEYCEIMWNDRILILRISRIHDFNIQMVHLPLAKANCWNMVFSSTILHSNIARESLVKWHRTPSLSNSCIDCRCT